MSKIGMALSLLAGLILAAPAFSADHRDAPALLFENGGDRSLDLNDVYLFRSPANRRNTVMAMTINPFTIGVGSDDPATGDAFSTTGAYDFKIDTNGDALEDITYTITFQSQTRYTVTETRTGKTPTVLTRNAIVGKNTRLPGGRQIVAATFDDPFFFDINGFRAFDADGAMGPNPPREFNDGNEFDFFAGFNTSAIVLEVPSSTFPASIGLWTRTLDEEGIQVDRTALPAINTVFIRPNRFHTTGANHKNLFNAGIPADDVEDFLAEATAVVFNVTGDMEYALAIAEAVLPDIMPFRPASSDGFLNGRRLADDVIDAELGLLTKQGLTTDGVPANDRAFRNTFPYLATPNDN